MLPRRPLHEDWRRSRSNPFLAQFLLGLSSAPHTEYGCRKNHYHTTP